MNILPKILKILWMALFFVQCQKPDAPQNHDQVFKPILTDSTLSEWIGNPDYWKFEDGILTGETTPQNILIEHSFFIWDKEIVSDFELKVEYRITPRGNSGINYRSEKVAGKEFLLKGYQADLDGENKYTGQIYEEKGRALLSSRNQITQIDENNTIIKIGTLGDEDALLASIRGDNKWNTYHLIVRDNLHVLKINDSVMSIAIDEGSHQKEGLLGFQLHLGPPMKVEFRKVYLKILSPTD